MNNEFDIKVTNLGKTFQSDTGDVVALSNVTFEVRRSNLFCIVGPSGCGKSTLLKLLLGLLERTEGNVWLHPDRVKEGIAYVQQTSLLLPWRSSLQNASLGSELKRALNATVVERIIEQIYSYGLGGFEQKFPTELSGGMKQRVDIIRALESRPRLLFCDEPFSAVDFVTRLELNSRFKRMCQVYGITTVFVTHNIEEAIFLGDMVAVMSGRPGRIVASYEPELSIGRDDAVRCREAPEFHSLFQSIWNDLKTLT